MGSVKENACRSRSGDNRAAKRIRRNRAFIASIRVACMKYLLLIILTACTPVQMYNGATSAIDIGCILTTDEIRADIRSGQKIKTNICKDRL